MPLRLATGMLSVGLVLPGCASEAPGVRSGYVVANSNLEPIDERAVLAILPRSLTCIRVHRSETACGLDPDALDVFDDEDFEVFFAGTRIASMTYDEHDRHAVTIEVELVPVGEFRGASAVLIVKLEAGKWRVVDAAMLVVD
jgi:hypothetical protein